MIDKIVWQTFERMRSVPKSEIVNARYHQKMEVRKLLLQSIRAEHAKAVSEEAKKMIVNCLIKRVEVYRDYKLHIDFNIDLEQFTTNLTLSVA